MSCKSLRPVLFGSFCVILISFLQLYFCLSLYRGLAHAHSAENLTELDPVTKLAGKYSLLGCDVTQAKHRALADCVSISALRATEILEYTLLKKLHSLQSTNNAANASGGDGIASIGKSLTDMFGWKGSSGGNNAAVPPKSPRRGTSAGAAAGSGNVGGNSAAGTLHCVFHFHFFRFIVSICEREYANLKLTHLNLLRRCWCRGQVALQGEQSACCTVSAQGAFCDDPGGLWADEGEYRLCLGGPSSCAGDWCGW